MSEITPSQTVGPYFAYGLAPHSRCNWSPDQKAYDWKETVGANLVTPDATGEKIRIEGRVTDGDGLPINDAMIEIWQADGQGRYAHPTDPRGSNIGFKGFGRCGTGTDPANRFVFETVKPGSVDGKQAPHVSVIVFMRGLLSHAYTRLYFSDEAEANAADPVLRSVPEARRASLIAKREDTASGPVYRFDIHMQGDAETIFFDV